MKKKTQKLIVWLVLGVMIGATLLSVVGSIVAGIYMG